MPPTPQPDDAEAVDHGGMRIGADEGVGIGGQETVLLPQLDGGGEVLQVDLVHDAHAGRHDPEVVECALRELEQLVALGVPAELQRHVQPESVGRAVVIDLDRVVDDEVAGHDRVDAVGVAAHLRHRVAHGGQVHHAGHAGEVLQHHPRGHEGKFRSLGLGRRPSGQCPDVVLGDRALSAPAQRIFQQDADREGEAVEVAHPLPGELGEAIDRDRLAAARHRAAGAEGIRLGGGHRNVRTFRFIERARRDHE